ncbi:MAG TPA: flavin reductase family protein [Smithellaceae bacterium]|nr:flavin reductase family protein [Smithellaceae bacterium]HRS84002.1 flavin reductase family protein [Smithellaceae bacterium]HRV44552.1 flavin reductase family protein [Smithellaceae bacterium]
MEKVWQDVFDRFTYGIYLVTISTDEGPNGMIASWLTQCSHEPPRLALAIRKNRLSHAQILETKKFCVNVLPKDLAHTIKNFKIAEWKKKFNEAGHSLSPHGLPVLDKCIGYLDCLLEYTIDAGDHRLFIGAIAAGGMKNPGKTKALSTLDYEGVYRGSA